MTKDGLEPTKLVIEKLRRLPRIDAIYSSDLGRAFITAYEIAFALDLMDMKLERVAGLREVDYGDAANMQSSEAYKLYPRLDRDTHFIPPNGQSLDDMQQCAIKAVVDIDSQYTDSTILIVAHSGVMAALDASYRDKDFGAHNISEAFEHDFVAEFTVSEGRIASFGDILI